MMLKHRLAPGLLLLLAVGVILFNAATQRAVAVTTNSADLRPAPAVATTPPGATAGCQPLWTIVNTPDGNPTPLGFNSVAGLASNDIWAVGNGNAGHTSFAIIEHWDGRSWQIANYAVGVNTSLNGVAEVSANDVWAVGVDGLNHTLALHWDGSAWSRISSPSPTNYDGLTRLAVLSASDIWAVGYTSIVTGSLSTLQTLTEHWDGSSWQVIPSPSAGNTNNDLIDVSAVSSNDIWAAGYYGLYGQPRNLAEHWDGHSWSIVDSPNPQPYADALWSVRAVASNDVWAAGMATDGHTHYTTALHWDGSSWQVVDTPTPGSGSNGLSGLAVVSVNDIWAVGDWFSTNPNQTLTEHWDGQQWSVVDSPNVPNAYNFLESVSTVSSTDVWAVGQIEGGDYTGHLTLAMHYGCVAPTATPTASPSPTLTPTNIPTSTPTARATPTTTPSATPPTTASPTTPPSATWTTTPTPLPNATATAIATLAATATPCGQSYADVPIEYWAYGYIRYLSCRSIVSGYSDGLFRPDNPISRAEFSKMLALGYGLPLMTPAQPSFADVPARYWAYHYIEALHAAGVISGYADGSFHPNTSISRAELVKMNVLASGVSAYTGTLADYPDVPPSYWAYGYIKTATYKQWVGGYPDGRFRPTSEASRAELGKVLYLSLSYPRQ